MCAHHRAAGAVRLLTPSRTRRTPYTAAGIRRVRCTVQSCRRRGYASWQVCADGRQFRAICAHHDVELNRGVLQWIGDPNIERKMARYVARPKIREALRDDENETRLRSLRDPVRDRVTIAWGVRNMR